MPTINAKYISIFLTTDCNLRCGYCYTQHVRDSGSTISLSFAKKGIDDFFNKYSYRAIRFQGGGEPTARIDILTQIIEYARSTYGEITTEIQTSGYFDESTANWIANNIDVIWVSYDGLPDVNDKHRPSVDNKRISDTVEKNIKILLAGPCRLGIRSTITTLNVYRQEEMVEHMSRLGVKSIYADDVFKTQFNESKMKACGYTMPHLMEYAENFLNAKKLAKKMGIFYGSWLSVNFLKKTDRSCTACIPYPRLTSDGYITSCDVGFIGENAPPVLVYGKWNDKNKIIDYYQDKEKYLSERNINNLKKCKGCEIGSYCAGSCMGKSLLMTGDIYKVNPMVCKATKYLAKQLSTETEREKYEYEHP